ncbi:MAG: NERD domain-containing protein [Clostridia bacterium]|nr:NERD domain-containing protein [Clostridia bacterium]
MENLKEIYKNLTGVDIEKEKIIWDKRGKGYYGEFLLFSHLYQNIYGHTKFLMNLEIPTENGKTTEIDLLMVNEAGIYVFEVKHFNGIIYGSDGDETWTQWFKTAPSQKFKSPVKQNEYHIQALKTMFPDAKISSFIVFSNIDCNLHTEVKTPGINVCKIEDIEMLLDYTFTSSVLSVEKIEEIFNRLSPYSKMQEPATVEGETAPFSAWVEPVLKELKKEKESTKTEKDRLAKRQTFYKIATACTVIFCIMFAVLSVIFTNSMTEKNERDSKKNTKQKKTK